MNPPELVLHVLAGEGIEGAEGLIEEQYVRLVGQNARQSDPLLHSAGKLIGPLGPEIPQLDQLEMMAHPLGALLVRQAAHARAEGDVSLHAQPGIELGLLEDQTTSPVRAVDLPALVEHRALVGVQESGHEPEHGGLAAARGPDDRDKLPPLDPKGKPIDRRNDAAGGAVGKRNVP